MEYSKFEIGKSLKEALNQGLSIEKIANWAYYDLYIKMPKKHSDDIEEILRNIYIMDAGPEFEYSKEELMLLADLLIKGDNEAVNKVNAVRLKRYAN